MAILEVNSQKISFNESNYLNLKSLIPKLQKKFPIDRFSVGQFSVNGIKMDINGEDPKLIRPISSSDHIEIQFKSENIHLANIISDLNGLSDKIIKRIIICTELLKDDQNEKAINHLSKIIDAVDIFIQAINHSCQSILDKDVMDSNLPIKELQIHLLSVIKAIHSAQQKTDHIMLTDLLEYELKDNLTQWKILILPILKQEVQRNP